MSNSDELKRLREEAEKERIRLQIEQQRRDEELRRILEEQRKAENRIEKSQDGRPIDERPDDD